MSPELAEALPVLGPIALLLGSGLTKFFRTYIAPNASGSGVALNAFFTLLVFELVAMGTGRIPWNWDAFYDTGMIAMNLALGGAGAVGLAKTTKGKAALDVARGLFRRRQPKVEDDP